MLDGTRERVAAEILELRSTAIVGFAESSGERTFGSRREGLW